VVEAADGAEALRILESREVNLLLTDVNMPGMSGVELLREIARLDRWPDLVRVIISTDGSASRRDEAAELDVRCYLEKPFSPEVLDMCSANCRISSVLTSPGRWSGR
jgi:CheY-like chemotaxis protein